MGNLANHFSKGRGFRPRRGASKLTSVHSVELAIINTARLIDVTDFICPPISGWQENQSEFSNAVTSQVITCHSGWCTSFVTPLAAEVGFLFVASANVSCCLHYNVLGCCSFIYLLQKYKILNIKWDSCH